LKQATAIDPGDRTAACTDRRDLDHGRAYDHAKFDRCLSGEGGCTIAMGGRCPVGPPPPVAAWRADRTIGL
jgi:hypothetical protein